jgi:phosphatidylserine/phosphatidylglycerophosphate/cardiolipin synthase-like enzyme
MVKFCIPSVIFSLLSLFVDVLLLQLSFQLSPKVRSVNFPKLMGGGVLHTKLWIIDQQHFYVGSANMDWRSLSEVSKAKSWRCSF